MPSCFGLFMIGPYMVWPHPWLLADIIDVPCVGQINWKQSLPSEKSSIHDTGSSLDTVANIGGLNTKTSLTRRMEIFHGLRGLTGIFGLNSGTRSKVHQMWRSHWNWKTSGWSIYPFFMNYRTSRCNFFFQLSQSLLQVVHMCSNFFSIKWYILVNGENFSIIKHFRHS